MTIRIIPYEPSYEAAANQLMRAINAEFNLPVGVPGYHPPTPDHYWLAIDGSTLIGMVSLVVIDHFGVVKRMFVNQTYRGTGVANQLLQTLLDTSHTLQLTDVYLGTIETFKAAHRFYERHGFKLILQQNLPTGYPPNPIDTLFYHLNLKS
jgi:GNAT superfamily N-acetyltransferase